MVVVVFHLCPKAAWIGPSNPTPHPMTLSAGETGIESKLINSSYWHLSFDFTKGFRSLEQLRYPGTAAPSLALVIRDQF